MQPRHSQHRTGLACAVAAFVLWGLFPLYWNWLEAIPSIALVSHRVVWACAVLLAVVPLFMATGKEISPHVLWAHLRRPRVWALYAMSALMLAINWLAFIWAVNHGQVLQASLGYYINPLLSILLGVLVLGERLLPNQWIAVGVAAIGVTILTAGTGSVPWASLAMATAFATYGLIKKKAPLPSFSGLLLEVLILSGPAIAYLTAYPPQGVQIHPWMWVMLVGGGAVTVLPLTLFAIATKRLPLSTVGVLQYIGPTLQFLVGVIVNNEAFGGWQFAGFVCVWIGSGFYLASSRRARLAERSDQASRVPSSHQSRDAELRTDDGVDLPSESAGGTQEHALSASRAQHRSSSGL